MIVDIIKNVSKQVCLFKWGYMTIDNENEAENTKIDHIDAIKTDLILDIETNMLDIKLSQYNDGYMY